MDYSNAKAACQPLIDSSSPRERERGGGEGGRGAARNNRRKREIGVELVCVFDFFLNLRRW